MTKKSRKKGKFSFVKGVHLPVNATVAARHLAYIEQQNGSLTPKAVLADARSPSSPIHDCFTWDNKVAAEKYRLEEAKYLIVSLRQEVVVPSGVVSPRVYVRLEGDAPHVFTQTMYNLSQADRRERMLEQALDELRRFEQKYAMLEELASVIAAARVTLNSNKVA